MFTQEVHEAAGGPTSAVLVVAVVVLGVILLVPSPQMAKVATLAATTMIFVLVLFMMRQFRAVRVQVDGTHLRVGFAWMVERVAIADIQACEPYTYQPMEWGGYGYRLGPKGVMFNVLGDHGVAVRVTTKDGRRLHFSSPDPQAVCRAIGEAQISRFREQ
jgi:hypothetical protein